MDFLKVLFENGALTWDQFVEQVNTKGFKLADLSTGNYVSKQKYENEIASRDTTIKDLNGQITNRDSDIAKLQEQINGEGDSRTKINNLNSQITQLQNDYATQKTEYEGRLKKQAYEFAVREFAGTQKFTSKAAQRDFTNEMILKNLKFEDNKLMGTDDFVKMYKEANPDAFVEEKTPEPEPKPFFGQPTPPQPQSPDDNSFLKAFNFAGVRPHDAK